MDRFAKDGTDRAMRVSATEREAGKRAAYHVYYRRNGKTMFDASYAATPQQAEKDMIGFANELRWKGVEVVGVISLVPDAPLS